MHLMERIQKVLIGLVTAVMVFAVGGAAAVQAASSSAMTRTSSATTASSKTKTAQQTQGLHLDVKSAIAIDEKTGQILYQQNADQSVPVASLSKLLTLYIVIQAIQDGKLSWNQMVKPSNNVCAVMMELVQGEGGVVPLDKEYVQAVAKACKEKDILLIVDEVQTGMGRTGSLFSYQQFGIQPDLVSCAKGLGGGLPIGAVLFGEKTETVFVPGDHGSTFGGNPVVCAGAVHILNTMDEAFLQDVQKKGAYLKEKIEKMPHVENVAGLGMMLGIQLDVEAKPVINALLEAGLLVLSAKTKIRLLPPLTITQEELDKGLTILEQTLASL